MNKRLGAIAVLVAAIAAATGLFASTSRSAPKAQLTIGLILQGCSGSRQEHCEKDLTHWITSRILHRRGVGVGLSDPDRHQYHHVG